MNNTIIEYSGNALRGNIELGPSKALIKALPGDLSAFWALRKTKNRMCVLSDNSLSGIINEKCDRYIYPGRTTLTGIVPMPGDTLFFSPSCVLPRAIVRDSYRITIKPDNADFTIMPNSNYYDSEDCDYNVAVKYKDNLILLSVVENSYNYKDSLDSNEFSLVKAEIDNFFGTDATFYFNADMKKSYASFSKKVKEVKDIVLNTYPTRKYIYEKFVDYAAPAKISAESLFIWSQLSQELKEKTIVSSDWKDYPSTIWNFTRKYSMNYGCKTQAFIAVRNYLENYFSSYDLKRNFVTSKDWNMFQKWIFKITGISEDGGTIPFSVYDKLTAFEKEVLFKRVAVKPHYLDESNTNNVRIGDVLPEK